MLPVRLLSLTFSELQHKQSSAHMCPLPQWMACSPAPAEQLRRHAGGEKHPVQAKEMHAPGGAKKGGANMDCEGCIEGDRAASDHTAL